MERRIKMRATVSGSPDGLSVHSYTSGKEYSINETGEKLMDIFISSRLADEIIEKPVVVDEQKMVSSATDNKAFFTAPSNKESDGNISQPLSRGKGMRRSRSE